MDGLLHPTRPAGVSAGQIRKVVHADGSDARVRRKIVSGLLPRYGKCFMEAWRSWQMLLGSQSIEMHPLPSGGGAAT